MKPQDLVSALSVRTRVADRVGGALKSVDNRPGVDLDPRPGEVVVGQPHADCLTPADGGGQEEILRGALTYDPANGKVMKAEIETRRFWGGDRNWNDGVNRLTVEPDTRRDGLFGAKHPVTVYRVEHEGNYRNDRFAHTAVERDGQMVSFSERGWRPRLGDFSFGQGMAGGALGLFASALPLAGAPFPVLLGVGVLCGAGLGAATTFDEGKGKAALIGAGTLTGLLMAGHFGGPVGILGAGAAMFALGGLGVFSGGY